jgi:hypothetical protein
MIGKLNLVPRKPKSLLKRGNQEESYYLKRRSQQGASYWSKRKENRKLRRWL